MTIHSGSQTVKALPKKANFAAEKTTTRPAIEYEKLSKEKIREMRKAQEQIFGVIKKTSEMPAMSYMNSGA